MDEMKITFKTKLMKGIIASVIRKSMKKQFGIAPDIDIDEISIVHDAGIAHLHISLDGEMTDSDLLVLANKFM